MTSILVIAEQRAGVLSPASFEAVAAAQKLAAELQAELDIGLIGDDLTAAAEELSAVRARRLCLVSDAELEPYRAETYRVAAQALVDELEPQLVLFPHTYTVRDYVPRLAAGYQRILVNDCIGYRQDDGQTVFVRQLFRSKLNADVRLTGSSPHFISFQPGAFRPEEVERGSNSAPNESVDVSFDASRFPTRSETPGQEETGGVDLTKAEIIVSVGRGIGEEENIALAEKLAQALKAELGSSRPLVDMGWMPKARQVGSSGSVVSPKLYVALGISGASQHMIGARGATTLVAINTDEKAPIFAHADYGIVGDVMELIPALIEVVQGS